LLTPGIIPNYAKPGDFRLYPYILKRFGGLFVTKRRSADIQDVKSLNAALLGESFHELGCWPVHETKVIEDEK